MYIKYFYSKLMKYVHNTVTVRGRNIHVAGQNHR